MSVLDFNCEFRHRGGFELHAAFTTDRLVTALFGPSGSGKTTVLHLIAGLLQPSRGEISLHGGSISHLPPQHRRIGFVFQDQLLFPHMNVERNLRYGLSPAGRSGRGLSRTAPQRVADVLELTPLLSRMPGQLSGGEKQRVAIGRALLAHPKLLLLDEPMTGLDEALKLRILGYVEQLIAEFDIPVLMVSHSQAEVRRLAQHVVMMRNGRVIAQGPPEAVHTNAAALETGTHNGVTNLLRIVPRKEGDRLLGVIDGQALHLPMAADPPSFVAFDADAVLLARHDVTDISARNHLRGVVTQVVTLSRGVLVAVDVGQTLWAAVTADAVHELNLTAGTPVVCIIKTQALRPLA